MESLVVFLAKRLLTLSHCWQDFAVEIGHPIPQNDNNFVYGALQRRVVLAWLLQIYQCSRLLGCVVFVHIGESTDHKLNIRLGPRGHLTVPFQNVIGGSVNVMQ